MLKPLIATLLIAVSCSAQTPERPPSLKKLIAADLAITSIDIASSIYMQGRGAREMNPMLGSHPSPARFAIELSGQAIFWDLAAVRLNRMGHHRIARAIMFGRVGVEGLCVGNNLVRIYQSRGQK